MRCLSEDVGRKDWAGFQAASGAFKRLDASQDSFRGKNGRMLQILPSIDIVREEKLGDIPGLQYYCEYVTESFELVSSVTCKLN